MDTNILETISNLVAQAAVAKAAPVPQIVQVSIWSNPAFITALVTLVAAIGTYIQVMADRVRNLARDVKIQKVTETIDLVHTTVNSAKTALEDAKKLVESKLEESNNKFLVISQELAVMKEKAHGRDVAEALKSQPATQPMQIVQPAAIPVIQPVNPPPIQPVSLDGISPEVVKEIRKLD